MEVYCIGGGTFAVGHQLDSFSVVSHTLTYLHVHYSLFFFLFFFTPFRTITYLLPGHILSWCFAAANNYSVCNLDPLNLAPLSPFSNSLEATCFIPSPASSPGQTNRHMKQN